MNFKRTCLLHSSPISDLIKRNEIKIKYMNYEMKQHVSVPDEQNFFRMSDILFIIYVVFQVSVHTKC